MKAGPSAKDAFGRPSCRVQGGRPSRKQTIVGMKTITLSARKLNDMHNIYN